MTRQDIATERASNMHDLALSVVRSKGVTKLAGSTTALEYKYGRLMIQYRSGKGELDVWFERACPRSNALLGSRGSSATRRANGNAT